MPRASPACSPVPFPLQRGAHLLPARGALRSHIIMHIRYKQSCLIILRHISDRVINKHCKINEEKCDLQFPLIGKALAVPRHKVIVLSRRRGRDGEGARCPIRAPARPRPRPCPDPCLLSPQTESWDSRSRGWNCQWPRDPGIAPLVGGAAGLLPDTWGSLLGPGHWRKAAGALATRQAQTPFSRPGGSGM